MYDSYQIDQYEKYNNMVNKFKKDNIKSHKFLKKWIKVDYSDIKINDIIIIYFYPNSQKYIYDLYPKAGKVIKIDSNDMNIENITIKPFNDKYNTDKLSHDWLGYFGNSRAYDYEIYKLKKIKPKFIFKIKKSLLIKKT